MEPAPADHHQQQQAHHPININNNDQELGGGGKNTSSTSNSNFLCRQSSTRWTPTSEQIRILKELYYNNGVRSPTAEQIQRISAKLRQYGKIEGKNVFYWFQNHKARERQKKRFTADHHLHHHHHQFHHNHVTMHRAASTSSASASASACKTNNNEDHVMISTRFYNKFSAGSNNINHGPAAGNFASSSNYTPGNLLPVASYGYGSVAMEKSFRECSITPNGGGSMAGQSFAWVGVNNDPSSYTFLEKRKYTHQTLEIEDNEDQEQDPTAANLPEIETLPLFPMHGDDIKNQETSDYFNGWHRRADDSFSAAAGGSRASLELTLNSYAARFSATSP